MLILRDGNPFDFEHQAYAHGVSTRGRMNAAVARLFRVYYPEMLFEYQRRCRRKMLPAGDVYFYTCAYAPSIFNLVTHNDLGGAPLANLQESIRRMYLLAREADIYDIGIPVIGCSGEITTEEFQDALWPFLKDGSHHVTTYSEMPF